MKELNLKITKRAYKDLKGIGKFTERKWGRKQRIKYLQELDKTFYWLCEHPNSGKNREDIKRGYFSFPCGSHLIFYMKDENFLVIIGVLHKSMDLPNQF